MLITDEQIIESLNILSSRCHYNSKNKGFWDDLDPESPIVQLAKLMLIDTESAEAAEAVRKGDKENLGEELADIIIRVMDLAYAKRIDIGQAVMDKMKANAKRPKMHGGKLA